LWYVLFARIKFCTSDAFDKGGDTRVLFLGNLFIVFY